MRSFFYDGATEVTMSVASGRRSSKVSALVKFHVAEVLVPPRQVPVWPRMCCCCLSTTDLDSIAIYSMDSSSRFGGRHEWVLIPYCRRCTTHHRRAGVRALESGAKVFGIGLTVLFVSFFFGMLNDPFVGFFL